MALASGGPVATPTATLRGSGRVRFLAAGTGLRIALVPVVMGLILGSDDSGLACALFAIAAATDYLDGHLARRWGVTTTLGSFLDTTADKLLVSGVLIALVQVGRASAWIVVLIVGRELVIMGLRGAIAAGGQGVMQPSLMGKTKTAIQFLAIALAIVRPGSPIAGLYLDQWAMLAAGAITLASAIDYISRFASSLAE
jgi:CDP-diacylglycerol--glycerol-3-phosphate 3-phosphatidyltransferase